MYDLAQPAAKPGTCPKCKGTGTNQALLETLAAVADDGGVYFDEAATDGRYFDFSTVRDGSRQFEISDSCSVVQMDLNRAEMLRLHAALTRTLMEDAQ